MKHVPRPLRLAALAGLAVVAGIGFEATSAAARSTPAARVPLRFAYLDGPPPGFAGGFGESTCHACHFEVEPNTAPGRVTVSGVPETFAPGESYPLTITLSRPGMALGGFQLTARFEEDGAQAGTLAPGEDEAERVSVSESGGVLYAYQRAAGAIPVSADTARWTVLWTAPADVPASAAATGPGNAAAVLFHVAANAADGDDSADGDYIYTVELRAVAARP